MVELFALPSLRYYKSLGAPQEQLHASAFSF